MSQVKLKKWQQFWNWLIKPVHTSWAYTGVAIAFSIALAVGSSRKHPVSGIVSVLLVILSGAFQLAAGSKLREEGRANPTLARSTVNRILNMGNKIDDVSENIDLVLDNPTVERTERSLREARIHLDHFRTSLEEQLYDWQQFHKDVVFELFKEKENLRKRAELEKKND